MKSKCSVARIFAKKLPAPVKSALRRVIRRRRRKKFAMTYYKDKLRLINEWARLYSEDSNFYYKITTLNRDQLAQLLASITGEPYESITEYFGEIERDSDLRSHIEESLVRARYGKDIKVNYGRRIGWYALVRILKPKIVVETGVDHGVGACVIASALLRNAKEGFSGRYYGTEIRMEAGKLLCGKYSEVGKILYGDSITSLENMSEQIDLFVNDSDHSAEYEYQEYVTIANMLSDHAFILGDNSHSTDCLSRFSLEQKRKYVFFSENPENHWYPGAGIGISY